nr:hypothetical protein Iba_chr06bCG13030 [Ipomoea batatas]
MDFLKVLRLELVLGPPQGAELGTRPGTSELHLAWDLRGAKLGRGLGPRSNSSTTPNTTVYEATEAEPKSSTLDLLKAPSSKLSLGLPQGVKHRAHS